MMPVQIRIGIAPGDPTGYAEAVNGHITACGTMRVCEALARAYALSREAHVFVTLGDCSKDGYKRDAAIWADFLTAHKIAHCAVPSGKRNAKNTAKYFQNASNWLQTTTVHGRDAAWLILGVK